MKRRDFVKGAAVLALARAGSAQMVCNNGTACNPATSSVLVWLEGPFALALRRDTVTNKIAGVTAFSPVDPDHVMNVLNGPQKGRYPFQFHFTLIGPGLKVPSSACVSADFKDFCEERLGMAGNPDNAFIRVLLPCPKNIYTSKLLTGSLGTGSAKRPVCIPQDHILEYEIVIEQPTSFFYEDAGQMLQPTSNVFHIEVGLPQKGSDPNGDHARHHHNKSILGYFPQLQADANRQLTSIGPQDLQVCPTSIPENVRARLVKFATTLECKTGGLIGGNP
jgi:hypothetical protein